VKLIIGILTKSSELFLHLFRTGLLEKLLPPISVPILLKKIRRIYFANLRMYHIIWSY